MDQAGNVYVGFGNGVNTALRFPAPIPTLAPVLVPGATGPGHSADVDILKARQHGMMNNITNKGICVPVGLAVAAGQLILADLYRLMYWNMPGLGPASSGLYNNKPADGFAGIDSTNVNFAAEPYSYYGYPVSFSRIREDYASPQQHLWAARNGGGTSSVEIYNLPLTPFAAPAELLANSIPLLGQPSVKVSWANSVFSVAPDIDSTGRNYVWISDTMNNRVFRVRNPLTNPQVDIILGQPDAVSNAINYIDATHYGSMQNASAASLYGPGNVELDKNGNLYVSDFTLESYGNWRLLRYDFATIQNNSATTPLFHIPASAVFARNGDFNTGYGLCDVPPAPELNACGPFEPAFTTDNSTMVLGTMYIGSQFPKIFINPAASPLVDGEASAYIKDFGSAYFCSTFDSQNNLYIGDLNRGRVLVYWQPVATPIPTPTPGCCAFDNTWTDPTLTGPAGGLAVDMERKRVYVMDNAPTNNSTLWAFDYNGITITSFGTGGSVSMPGGYGIARGRCNFDGIYVVNRNTFDIIKVDASGNTTLFAALPNSGLRSVNVDSYGNAYVTNDQGLVYELDPTGTQRALIQSTGLTLGPLTGGVKTGTSLYLNDTTNSRVVKYIETGGLNSYVYSNQPIVVSTMSGWPTAMAMDMAGNIYVLSGSTGGYVVYNNSFSSQLLGCVPGFATGNGIDVDQNGNVYLADTIFGVYTAVKMKSCNQLPQPAYFTCNQTATVTITYTATRTYTQTFTATASPTQTLYPATFTATCTTTPAYTQTPVCDMNLSAMLYPNPCNGRTVNLLFDMCGVIDLRVKIFTVSMRKVYNNVFAGVTPGTKLEIILENSRKIDNGIYFVDVTAVKQANQGKAKKHWTGVLVVL